MPPERFSHSSLATWRRCRYRYYLQYICNYSPPRGAGLIRGSTGHAGLEEWYKNGGDDEKALQAASNELESIESETGNDYSYVWEEIHPVLMRYFGWARVHDNFEALETEYEYEIELAGIKLFGYIDAIVNWKGYNYILEHKFVKQASVSHISIDMQVSIYMLAASMLGFDPQGVLYNVIRVGNKGIAVSEPVLRKPVYRNGEGLELIAKELGSQMLEVKQFNEQGKDYLRIYRNPTKDCSWDCAFYPACLSLNDCGSAEPVLRNMQKRNFADQEKADLKMKGDVDAST